MPNNGVFYLTTDLSFVASSLLIGGIHIEKITSHPQKINLKVFHLSPKEKAEELYRKFASDEIKLSPQQLSSKITFIKNLPISEETF